jgi:hypothetical protein
MADNTGGGYTGVVDSQVAAPFTGAEGYSGVVYSDVASGFTGLAAPAGPPGAGAQAPVTAAPAQTGPGVTPSSYDQAVMTGGSAPASNTATSYAPPPPDLSDQDLQTLADASGSADSGGAASDGAPATPQYAGPHANMVDELVRDYTDAVRQIQLSPMPEPNRTVQEARRLLHGLPSPPLTQMPSSRQLIGAGADWLQNQAAQAIASTRPSTLGEAYLQGIMQESVTAITGAAAGIIENVLDSSSDPVGAAIENARQLIGTIKDHMSQGEGFWEAVNSTLNPAVQVLNQAWTANQVAGQALAAYQAGHWDEAVRLARLAGRSALRASAATVSTVTTAMGVTAAGGKAVGSVRAWRQRTPGRLPAPPPSPRMPESKPLTASHEPPPLVMESPPRSEIDGVPAGRTPRSDGITGTVVHGEGGPEALVLAPATTPYPAFPQVEVQSSGFVRAELEELGAVYKGQQSGLADRMAALPPSERLNPQNRNPIAKAAINTKEKMTTAANQLAYPDRAYLDQVTLDVVTGTGEIIEGADVPGVGKGRNLDGVALYPDQTWDPLEYKTSQSILKAYPAGPNVIVPGFKPSTPLGDQLARQQKIIDYARSNGYQLRLRGTPVGGGPSVDVVVSPGSSRGGHVLPYYQVPN